MTALDKALPQFLGAMLDCLPPKEREGVEELRLREGFPLSAVQAGEEWTHPAWRNRPLTEEDLRRVVETAGRGSGTHHFRPTARGLCHRPRRGTPGDLWGGGGPGRDPPVLPAHHLPGPPGAPHHGGDCPPPSAPAQPGGPGAQHPHPLPAGAGKDHPVAGSHPLPLPGGGDGAPPGGGGRRAGGAGGRGELRYTLGPRADVLENCPKDQALLMLLRGMAPQVLAADEITHPADLRAMETAAGCGVTLLATAHGGSWEELSLRPLYRELLGAGIFQKFVFISLAAGRRVYTVQDGGGPL